MPVWLVPIIAYLSKNVERFIGVALITILVVAAPMVIYHNICVSHYNLGYKAGYSQAIKDHPTVSGNNNTIITGQQEPFFLLKVWKLRIGI